MQWNALNQPYPIDETVDGVAILFYFGGFYVDFTSPIAMTAIPEPAVASIVILLGSLTCRSRQPSSPSHFRFGKRRVIRPLLINEDLASGDRGDH